MCRCRTSREWRGVARETAGVLQPVETYRRNQPGTIGGHSRRIGSIGAEPSERPGGFSIAQARTGGVAAIVAQSGMTNESPMAWMMLLDQLGRTLRAMSAAHVARGEAEMQPFSSSAWRVS